MNYKVIIRLFWSFRYNESERAVILPGSKNIITVVNTIAQLYGSCNIYKSSETEDEEKTQIHPFFILFF